MQIDDVRVEKKEQPFRGYFRIDRYHLRHRLFAGGWSDVMTREIFERGHAAAALLYDPQLEKLVLVEQFRIGAYAAIQGGSWEEPDASPWLIELVAGIVEKGETPEDVIRREAMEEAGLKVIGELMPVCRYLVSPGGTTESLHILCGRVDAAGAGGIHGLKHEHEDIRVMVVGVEEAMAMMDDGRICNSMTIIGLQWLRHNREKVRRRLLAAT